MITFDCPGCTKPLEANRAFVGFDTRCLRCGTVIRIPSKSGELAETLSQGELPKPKASAPSRRVAPLPPIPEQTFEIELGPDFSPAATATLEPPVPKRRSLKAEVVPEAPPESSPSPSAPATPARKKNKKLIGGSVAVLVLAIAGAAYGFGGKGSKAVAKKPDPAPAPAPAQQRQEETPKVEEVKKVEPKPVVALELAPLPRPIRPAVEYEITAAALLVEYGESPPATDVKYEDKDLLVRGVFHHYSLGKVTLLGGDEKSTPIAFTLLPPAELRRGDLLPDPGLVPGQPVVLRGTYRTGCRFSEATIELTDSPAERAYSGKSVCLDGAVVRSVVSPTGSAPFPALILEPHATDSKLTVTCYFKVSELDSVMKVKPGQKLDVRGRCSGRTYSAVRLDNCAIVTPETAPGPEVTRLAATAFFTEYEADLLSAPRVNPREMAIELLPVTAEGLGHAYQVDPRSANITYRNKAVQLSGYVKERHAATRMLVFQCGTDTTFSVAAVFSPAAYDSLTDEKSLVIRGVCSGLIGGYIRIESAEHAETGTGLAAMRTDLDFLPYRLGKEYIVDQLSPGRGKDSQIKRMAIRFGGGDQIHVIIQKSGTIPGNTLFREPHPEPKWAMYPPKLPALTRHYRSRDGVVEIGLPVSMGEKKEVTEFWEPVLKAGLKKGQSWFAKFPDGRDATYTVAGFAKQPGTDLDQLEIKRILRSPTDPKRWEETSSTYVRGIGEIRRIVSHRADGGESMVYSESRLVSDGSQPELRSEPKK